MIKKTLILSILVILALSGCTAQNVNWQEKDTKYSGDYKVDYDFPNIEVAIGGKKFQTSMSSIESGEAKVGEITLPTDIADKIEAELTKDFNFKINGPAKLTATNLDTSETRSGLFMPKKNSFLFGKVEAVDPAAKNCGAIGGTAVSGKFNDSGIENGKTTVGFIAGCAPIVVAARATVSWTATKQ